uniref:Uncharacterized protein n=1 Tax=Nothobranchius furzeri TaxID=105023 RepID=A0A1A8UJL7_NOTFU
MWIPHLPLRFHMDRLGMHLKMIGDVFSNSPGNTVQDVTATMSKLHPQTRVVFKKAEYPHQCSCLPVSAASSEMFHSAPPEHMVTHNHDTTRLTYLALMQVHEEILDSLDIGSLIRSFISANPERKATSTVV